ncbi:MAG: Nif3-like dinuclear metal center hexameric protein [Gemmatimonadaceae bacterium]|nr:Nif3-like dinuclear metal center hexameric protein [Gemmatimonadaceae bacterium]MDQ3519151.1 Nif3-like dinuclear metal center hexameric protein [Gemmatimonadota bacterium]
MIASINPSVLKEYGTADCPNLSPRFRNTSTGDSPFRQGDATGNGLLVSGRPLVARIGAALNTSHAAIAAADASAVDLLLVHHAPWAEIDLHLREGKIARLRELGISLYAAHESLDHMAGDSTGSALTSLIGIASEEAREGEMTIGAAPHVSLDEWLQAVAAALQAPVRAWPNNPVSRRAAIVPGGGGSTQYLARAAAEGCDTFLTGEGSIYTELFAREVGLTFVYATHSATEFPAVCSFVQSVAKSVRRGLAGDSGVGGHYGRWESAFAVWLVASASSAPVGRAANAFARGCCATSAPRALQLCSGASRRRCILERTE